MDKIYEELSILNIKMNTLEKYDRKNGTKLLINNKKMSLQ